MHNRKARKALGHLDFRASLRASVARAPSSPCFGGVRRDGLALLFRQDRIRLVADAVLK